MADVDFIIVLFMIRKADEVVSPNVVNLCGGEVELKGLAGGMVEVEILANV